MKRWLTHATIAAYISVLGYGIACHAVSYKVSAHPLMYYIVWDMFCGWAAYSTRTHIVGQGESGKYYELSPGPWGDFEPFGHLGRRHYDTFTTHAPRLAQNTLKHTQHEPMSRVFVIEESWPKKFNLPDRIWEKSIGDERDFHKYYHVRAILDGDCRPVKVNPLWLVYQSGRSITNNPRLQADSKRGKQRYAVSLPKHRSVSHFADQRYDPSDSLRSLSPSAQ